MITRIISGAVLILIASAIVFLTLHFQLPIVLIAFLSFVGAVAVYEMLKNTGLAKRRLLIAIAVIYAALSQPLFAYLPTYAWYLAIAYGVLSVIFCIVDNMSYKKTVFVSIIPVLLSYCFSCLSTLLNLGLVHIIMLLNFSSVCDCGAYFVGVTLGKHKLCPKISPKKTIEGAIGGIIFSMLVTGAVARLFGLGDTKKLVIITPLLCIAGMIGDLSASVIKRKVGIKDYGKIIPGHGGIMDRFDSILLIAPIYVFLYSLVG